MTYASSRSQFRASAAASLIVPNGVPFPVAELEKWDEKLAGEPEKLAQLGWPIVPGERHARTESARQFHNALRAVMTVSLHRDERTLARQHAGDRRQLSRGARHRPSQLVQRRRLGAGGHDAAHE